MKMAKSGVVGKERGYSQMRIKPKDVFYPIMRQYRATTSAKTAAARSMSTPAAGKIPTQK